MRCIAAGSPRVGHPNHYPAPVSEAFGVFVRLHYICNAGVNSNPHTESAKNRDRQVAAHVPEGSHRVLQAERTAKSAILLVNQPQTSLGGCTCLMTEGHGICCLASTPGVERRFPGLFASISTVQKIGAVP